MSCKRDKRKSHTPPSSNKRAGKALSVRFNIWIWGPIVNVLGYMAGLPQLQ